MMLRMLERELCNASLLIGDSSKSEIIIADPPCGIINATDNVVIFIYIIHDKADSIFVINQQIKMFHYFNRFLSQHPTEQRIDTIGV